MENAREIGVRVAQYKTTLVEEVAVKEELVSVNHNMVDKRITLQTRFFNSSNEVIKEENIFILGENYDLLMSESKVFEEGKMLGIFRDSDLWYVIDKIREDQLVISSGNQ